MMGGAYFIGRMQQFLKQETALGLSEYKPTPPPPPKNNPVNFLEQAVKSGAVHGFATLINEGKKIKVTTLNGEVFIFDKPQPHAKD